jgi:hypothetical protein
MEFAEAIMAAMSARNGCNRREEAGIYLAVRDRLLDCAGERHLK